MSHKGVRIEPYERSRVELMLAEPVSERFRNKLVLSFEFKTLSANGTLFYGRSSKNPNEMIALVLRNGHLVYKIQCPSLHADVRLSTRESEPLNNNRWHSVYYTVSRLGFLYTASLQQGDLSLSGPPSGQGAGGGAQIRYRRVPARPQGRFAIHSATGAPSESEVHKTKDWPLFTFFSATLQKACKIILLQFSTRSGYFMQMFSNVNRLRPASGEAARRAIFESMATLTESSMK
ncbi:hypothetical protein PoB_005693000 [Plakobranchus ocellatus]|uniref:Laminin G domain-containing protein n=1 Tax=Plakobranchus ocellatus TaxID=259542 RepID=A0AAV4CFC8_9GAST|nr:hypothetical protein PoB_005693000 [Plakobranchus ocellatus]